MKKSNGRQAAASSAIMHARTVALCGDIESAQIPGLSALGKDYLIQATAEQWATPAMNHPCGCCDLWLGKTPNTHLMVLPNGFSALQAPSSPLYHH